ncbi:KinB-signaling pathway activation protein [Bacillus massilinigeriensis]|uniref:KinB-signaling pathway activation protein n=1 Tax=Bacillus mediterraneensis TaxID=1805474 RepID=UPI0008F82D88|nr:KinB-signaling pathway activation protein [Bacillus mediterraneensis]
MTSRNWVRFFLSTLLVGVVTASITGFIVRWEKFKPLFIHFDILEILSVLLWLIGIGLIFSILSQMGFFAYLTIHQFGLGMFRSASLWNAVQLILIAVAFFDLVYLRYNAFAEKGEGWGSYLLLAVLVAVPSFIVAYLKAKQTNKESFIPALFFMVVVTIIEWVPVLRVNEHGWLYLMLFSLIACNAYQLLMLPKYNRMSQEEREQAKARRELREKAKTSKVQ